MSGPCALQTNSSPALVAKHRPKPTALAVSGREDKQAETLTDCARADECFNILSDDLNSDAGGHDARAKEESLSPTELVTGEGRERECLWNGVSWRKFTRSDTAH